MTPETNIINAVPNLWVEKFPEGNVQPYPKGLIKRVSMVKVNEKDNVARQYLSRVNILWYDKDTRGFDSQMSLILDSVYALVGNKIKNIKYEGRDDGYDHRNDTHVMNMEFIIKHFL